ncbi:MAG: DNA/RNA non-specific endonuclease [Lachnospiraceae bacterium]|nr:DNA/RNA non-specific endonuclease [Lachnospiraceae bacterium]
MSSTKKNGKTTKKNGRGAVKPISVFLALIIAIVGLGFGVTSPKVVELLGLEEVMQTFFPDYYGQSSGIGGDVEDLLLNLPDYSGSPYVTVNGNNPYFEDAEVKAAGASFETYSDLDDLGRCGACTAGVGRDIMPTDDRGEIGSVKPSGWNQKKYAGLVEGNYLYNRCHLIGYQLTGENANTKNLITGTRYLNVDGMLPFENMVADYVKETGNHVLYRVTPLFSEDDLVARGVLMEAKSVEDDGDGVLFCVFCYNVQPGIVIDYSDGSSREK